MSANASSAVARPAPPVLHTVTLCALAASRSMEALRLPVVTSRRSLGSFSNSARENGVRSRMMPITSNSASARAAASTSGSRSVEHHDPVVLLQARPVGHASATFW